MTKTSSFTDQKLYLLKSLKLILQKTLTSFWTAIYQRCCKFDTMTHSESRSFLQFMKLKIISSRLRIEIEKVGFFLYLTWKKSSRAVQRLGFFKNSLIWIKISTVELQKHFTYYFRAETIMLWFSLASRGSVLPLIVGLRWDIGPFANWELSKVCEFHSDYDS